MRRMLGTVLRIFRTRPMILAWMLGPRSWLTVSVWAIVSRTMRMLTPRWGRWWWRRVRVRRRQRRSSRLTWSQAAYQSTPQRIFIPVCDLHFHLDARVRSLTCLDVYGPMCVRAALKQADEVCIRRQVECMMGMMRRFKRRCSDGATVCFVLVADNIVVTVFDRTVYLRKKRVGSVAPVSFLKAPVHLVRLLLKPVH